MRRLSARAPARTDRERVRLSTKLYYGAGAVAQGSKNTAFNVFLLFYYNQVLGLPGTMSGTAIFVALCIDAITDPLMGSISDNFHSRWGRRHPFMYTSVLPTATCFFLLFNPPAGLGHQGLFVWLTIFAVGVRVSMTLYAIPSDAMVPEITSHYDERTSLISYRFLFGWLGGLTSAQMGYLYFFAPSERFADGRLNADAYRIFALVCALLIAAAILTCALGTHRLIPTLKSPSEKVPFSLRRLVGELRQVLRNRSYLTLLIGTLFAAVAGGFSDALGLYMSTYFWEFTTSQLAILLYAFALATLLAFALTRPITERFDKKASAMGLVTFAILFGPLPVFLRLLGLMPENGEPLLLYVIFVHALCLVTVVVAIGIILASMIADVVDENELMTGRRQEGMFMATIAFVAKATSGVGGFLAGVVLDMIAFPTGAEPGAVPPAKVFTLGLAVGPGLMGLYLLAWVFLSRYRITRERHSAILAALEEKRKSAALLTKQSSA